MNWRVHYTDGSVINICLPRRNSQVDVNYRSPICKNLQYQLSKRFRFYSTSLRDNEMVTSYWVYIAFFDVSGSHELNSKKNMSL